MSETLTRETMERCVVALVQVLVDAGWRNGDITVYPTDPSAPGLVLPARPKRQGGD